jgi:hypothetical protein
MTFRVEASDPAGHTVRCEPLGARWHVIRTIGQGPYVCTLLSCLEGPQTGELSWQHPATLHPCEPVAALGRQGVRPGGMSSRVLAGREKLPRDPLLYVETHAEPSLGVVARSTLAALRGTP